MLTMLHQLTVHQLSHLLQQNNGTYIVCLWVAWITSLILLGAGNASFIVCKSVLHYLSKSIDTSTLIKCFPYLGFRWCDVAKCNCYPNIFYNYIHNILQSWLKNLIYKFYRFYQFNCILDGYYYWSLILNCFKKHKIWNIVIRTFCRVNIQSQIKIHLCLLVEKISVIAYVEMRCHLECISCHYHLKAILSLLLESTIWLNYI